MPTFTIPDSKKLSFGFDNIRLKADLGYIEPKDWISHYRSQHYYGEWGLVPLRSVGGHPAIIYSVPSGTDSDYYKDTPILKRCSYYQEVITYFECPVNAVRLMKLGSGSKIFEHTDYMEAGEDLEIRLHIPITTHPSVSFYINGKVVPMQPGEVWVGNFNLPHRVENNSPEDRIHMVLDCSPNTWLLDQIN